MEAQIGTVWQAAVIDEIIAGGVPGSHSSAVEATPAEIRDVINACWPRDSADFAKRAANPDIPLYFTATVMEALKGRADPADVTARVREAARVHLGKVEQPAMRSP